MKLALAFAAALALLGCEKKKAAPATPSAPTATTPPPAGAVPAAPVPVEASPDGLKLGSQAPKVGEVRTEREEQLTNLKVDAGGKTIEIVGSERKVERQEVVAATGDVVDKLKLTFVEFDKQEKIGGKDRPAKGSVAGKTYLVWREGGELKVTLEDGSAPSADEVKAVTKGNRGVGKPDAMETFVASRAWKVGEVVTPDAAQLATIGESMSDDSSKLSAMSLTLTEATDATATFAMKMSMGGATDEGGAMKIDMAGVVVVDRKTGIAQSLDLNGPFSGTAGKALLKIAGTMSSKVAYTY